MGLRYRKSYKSGPFRVTISKSGVGWSVGGKGFRYTKTANGRTRKTYSVPGTGISYVTESGKKNNSQSQTTQKSTSKTTNTDQEWEIYSPLFTKAREIEKENPDIALVKYMDILSRFKPTGTAYYERPAILLERNKRYQEAIDVCELALKNLAAFNPHTYEGCKEDFEKRIDRCKRKIEKAANEGDTKPKSKPRKKSTPTNSDAALVPVETPAISSEIVFPAWYVSVSFGRSRSESFDKALALAQSAPQFVETEQNGVKIYQAIYSDKKSEYLAFIKLYELVKNWKSSFVIINGEHIDRKIIGQINYCYGDCCRSGSPDFCFGASAFTDNPFGCHRIQISSYNHPWYTFGTVVGGRYIKLDKKQILERAESYAEIYHFCPKFNWEKIKSEIEALPDMIDMKEHPEFTIIGNQIYRTYEVPANVNIQSASASQSKTETKSENISASPQVDSDFDIGCCIAIIFGFVIFIIFIISILLG